MPIASDPSNLASDGDSRGLYSCRGTIEAKRQWRASSKHHRSQATGTKRGRRGELTQPPTSELRLGPSLPPHESERELPPMGSVIRRALK